LAFAILGYEPGSQGYYDTQEAATAPDMDLTPFPEANRLMSYLESDQSDTADPQRDAMRFMRKAVPTHQYLGDMLSFLKHAHSAAGEDGTVILVVAGQHTFYSHRRQQIEHVVSGRQLYAELAEKVGLELAEEIPMELMKSAVSMARPRAQDDYFESVLLFRARAAPSVSRPKLRSAPSHLPA